MYKVSNGLVELLNRCHLEPDYRLLVVFNKKDQFIRIIKSISKLGQEGDFLLSSFSDESCECIRIKFLGGFSVTCILPLSNFSIDNIPDNRYHGVVFYKNTFNLTKTKQFLAKVKPHDRVKSLEILYR